MHFPCPYFQHAGFLHCTASQCIVTDAIMHHISTDLELCQVNPYWHCTSLQSYCGTLCSMDDEEDVEMPEIPVTSGRMRRPKHRERGSKSKQASSLTPPPLHMNRVLSCVPFCFPGGSRSQRQYKPCAWAVRATCKALVHTFLFVEANSFTSCLFACGTF